MAPLADRIRPLSVDDVFGQQHILGKGKALRRIIESGNIPNLIFYGPSGVGKTTVAEIIAAGSGKKLFRLNATTASTADIKNIIASIGGVEAADGVLLYLDEIQYFTKKQQQTLLQFMESGEITLIASTTENPYFYVYNAIISRSTVFEFKPLSAADIKGALHRAAEILSGEEKFKIIFESGADDYISAACGGDVRKALNALDIAVLAAERTESEIIISRELAEQLLQKQAMRFDRRGDENYDAMSAFQKSMRGSDPDAAVHYLARLLEAGDLPTACRRLMVCACEDVGLAYPQIIPIVKAAVDAALMLGLPEARIPLADAAILVAITPKSNSGEKAIDAAMRDIENGRSGNVPRALQNKHFDGAEVAVKGQFYKYPHDFPNHYTPQQYLPDEIKDAKYYNFGNNKNEQAYKQYWEKVKNK